jgi:gluconolactonase
MSVGNVSSADHADAPVMWSAPLRTAGSSCANASAPRTSQQVSLATAAFALPGLRTRLRARKTASRALVALLWAAAAVCSSALASAPGLCGDCKAERFAACGGFLEGATIDSRGGLWVVDLLSGKVLSVSEDGRCTARGNTGGQPNGAKFGPDGKLWIADKQRGLLRMEPDTGVITVIAASYKNERLRGLNDLVFDSTGGVYFTEPYGSSALKADGRLFYLPAGPDARLQVVSEGLAFPNGVVVTRSGTNVLVGEYALKRIVSLPAVGSKDEFDVAHVVALTSGGIGPDGMTLTPDGTLVAANFNAGEVITFNAKGHPQGAIALPGGLMVTNVAIGGDWLYITEGSRGEVWRVRLNGAKGNTRGDVSAR